MGKLAALCVALAACIATPEERAPVAVSGSSPLVGAFERAAQHTGVPVELLATIEYVEHRFRIDEDTVLADAMAIADQAPGALTIDDYLETLEPMLRRTVMRSLERGVDARDAGGKSIVVAARGRDPGTVTQAVGYEGATFEPASTANYDRSNRGVGDITNIVIHTTQGSFSGTIGWFQNPSAQVSAHYVVRSSDGFVVQMVDETDIAWHDKCFNTRTVGIEHEGFIAEPELWYSEPMYIESAKLTAYLADKYGIAKEYGPIVGHDAAPDCSDHTDPGDGWDWAHYIDLVKTGGAQFAGDDVTVEAPRSLEAGERATITVTVTNRGNTAWELDATRLGTALPTDRESELFVDGDWIAPNRATSVDDRVGPGGVGTFTFEIVAPDVSEPTVYDEAFQMVEEDVTWFGPDIHVVMQVTPRADRGGCDSGGGGGGALLAAVVAFCARGSRRRTTARARRL